MMSTKNQIPSQEWLEKYEKVKSILAPPFSFEEIYSQKDAFGKKLFILNMGEVHFPTGEILVRDPLYFLHRDQLPYFQKVPTGKFPLNTQVVEVEEDHYRYVSTRVKFSDKKAVRYTEALIGNENLDDDLEEGNFFGFFVDAGLATIVDVKTRDAFCDFQEKWYKEQSDDANIYDDLFAEEFAKSYKENPQFQREGGDWINFKIPNTDLSVPMIQSGWGDGQYPVYFGYDENNEVCEVVIEYFDLELTFGQEEE